MEREKTDYADDYIELLRDQYEKIDNEVWYEIIDKHKEYPEQDKKAVENAKVTITKNKELLKPKTQEAERLKADLTVVDRMYKAMLRDVLSQPPNTSRKPRNSATATIQSTETSTPSRKKSRNKNRQSKDSRTSAGPF